MAIDTVDEPDVKLGDLTRLAAVFKSLGDPHRLGIVQHLFRGEHRVTDLVAHLGLAQSTVSSHVATLRDASLLASHAHGRAMYYTLAHPQQIRRLMLLADILIRDGGECAELCGMPDVECRDEPSDDQIGGNDDAVRAEC